MLFYGLCAICAFYPFVRKKCYRIFVFILTIILSLFFFDSKDPFIEMPIYMYTMVLSILLGLFGRKKYTKADKNFLIIFGLIILCMLFSILMLALGINVQAALLLKKSSTDTLSISNELLYATVDFVVIKHFLFYVVYLLFLFFNRDCLMERDNRKTLILACKIIFKILFVFLIVESIITNVFGAWTDRNFITTIFNTSLNQGVKWIGYTGLYTSTAWFAEPSNLRVVIIYYLIRLTERRFSFKSTLWDLLSYVAVVFNGSSTALVIAAIYIVYTIFYFVFSSKKIILKLFGLVLLVACIIIFIQYDSVMFSKVDAFISGDTQWGSAYFRSQSITYAIDIIKYHPLFGLGIGTVYCHAGLFQSLANIGLVGTVLLVYVHVMFLKESLTLITVLKIIFVLGISTAAFMVQEVTSPFMCILMMTMLAKPQKDVCTKRCKSAIKECKNKISIGDLS